MVKKDHLPDSLDLDTALVSRVRSPEISHFAWERPLPADFREPTRAGYRPYEPTPIANLQLNPFAVTDEFRMHHRDVATSIDPLFSTHAPQEIPARLRAAVEQDHVMGNVLRLTESIQSYAAWANTATGMTHRWDLDNYLEGAALYARVNEQLLQGDQRLIWLHDRLLIGAIEPDEVLEFMLSTSLNSAEMTKLSHPYGFRMGLVADARRDVTAAIVAHAGTLYPQEVTPYERIHSHPEGLVTYKRKLGHITDADQRRIYAIERQSAAIHLSGERSDASITELVQTNSTELIPLSTMTYAARESDKTYEERLRLQQMSGRVEHALADQAMNDMLLIDYPQS